MWFPLDHSSKAREGTHIDPSNTYAQQLPWKPSVGHIVWASTAHLIWFLRSLQPFRLSALTTPELEAKASHSKWTAMHSKFSLSLKLSFLTLLLYSVPEICTVVVLQDVPIWCQLKAAVKGRVRKLQGNKPSLLLLLAVILYKLLHIVRLFLELFDINFSAC